MNSDEVRSFQVKEFMHAHSLRFRGIAAMQRMGDVPSPDIPTNSKLGISLALHDFRRI